jgi:hypothetical protein
VAGARVLLARDGSCITPERESITDPSGAFTLDAIEEFKWYVPSPFRVEPLSVESVCIVTPEEGRLLGYADTRIALELELRCDLAVPAQHDAWCSAKEVYR